VWEQSISDFQAMIAAISPTSVMMMKVVAVEAKWITMEDGEPQSMMRKVELGAEATNDSKVLDSEIAETI
jgi:hypothetical protein